jgi:K+-sensing histidine kinase KdpD
MNDRLDGIEMARRYATALVAVAITIAVKVLVNGLGDDHPFVLLPVPVAVAAWYGGRGPGVVAAGLVTIVGLMFMTQSAYDSGDIVALLVVAVEAVVVVWITAGLRDALARAERSRIAADAARRELTFAVAVRDEVLRFWTEKVRGPLAQLEVKASSTLVALERDGYRGTVTQELRSLVDDAGTLRRVTAGWNQPAAAKTEDM